MQGSRNQRRNHITDRRTYGTFEKMRILAIARYQIQMLFHGVVIELGALVRAEATQILEVLVEIAKGLAQPTVFFHALAGKHFLSPHLKVLLDRQGMLLVISQTL